MASPLISICLPTVNARRFIEPRVASILAQTEQDWELIVCDSFSTDGTWEFLQTLAGDRRVRLYQVPRAGPYAGMNECLSRATGEYVYIATADDVVDSCFLEKLLVPLTAKPEIAAAFCDFLEIDETGKPAASCDVVYHAHMLEHLRRDRVLPFLQECRRVLSPNGTLRIVTPDFEQICRLYLEKLNAVANNAAPLEAEYHWIILELIDQTVREESGGEMRKFLARDPLLCESFVLQRIGSEGEDLLRSLRRERARQYCPAKISLRERIWNWRQALISLPFRLRLRIAKTLMNRHERHALDIGLFRLVGEVHHWIYDRLSLRLLLEQAGFTQTKVQTADQSRIPGWTTFNLDTKPDGSVRKPDSFFMEAIR